MTGTTLRNAVAEGGNGLANTRRRHAELYGSAAALTLRLAPEGGNEAELRRPVTPLGDASDRAPDRTADGWARLRTQPRVRAARRDVVTRALGSPPQRRLVVIADDEAITRERLSRLLARHPRWKVAAERRDGPAAVRAIRAARPDLVLLDPRTPGLDGLTVAEAVAAAGGTDGMAGGAPLDGKPAVVFVTASDRFALPAFDVSAEDYLLKPVERERFARALARVESRFAPDIGPGLAPKGGDSPW